MTGSGADRRNRGRQGYPRGSQPVALPSVSDNPAWAPRPQTDRHLVPQQALEFGTAPVPTRQARPKAPAPAAPPCAALQAVLTCFSLHQRASFGTPLSEEERRVLQRIEEALRSADIRSRRRWKRHTTSRPVRINRAGRGSMVDLSAGGLRINHASTLPPRGSSIDVSMRVAVGDRERVLVFPSRVSWLDSHAGSIGVAFVAPARWER